jgi:hypothetical protein
MSIYLSHARKDSDLALQLAKRLKHEGLTVLHPETDFASGENWAKEIGEALDSSDFMVFLLTPGAMQGDWMRKDVEFALGSKKYDGRVYSVLVGPTMEAGNDVPWILLRQPHRHVESAKAFGKVAKEIAAQCGTPESSSSNA